MRTFGTQGPVNPHDNYIITRSTETADFIERVKRRKVIMSCSITVKNQNLV